jgi:hypothetical protein
MVSLPKLTLTYFNFGGRAEPLRLAAAIGKVCRIDVYPSKDFLDPKLYVPVARKGDFRLANNCVYCLTVKVLIPPAFAIAA